MQKWGFRLKEIRENHGLSQYDLGVKVGKDVTQISRYETQKASKEKISKRFKKLLEDIFTADEIEYIENGTEVKNIITQSGKNSVGTIDNTKGSVYVGDRVNEVSAGYGSGQEGTVSVPYYPDVYASAGGGAMVYESLAGTVPLQLSKVFVQDFLRVPSHKNLHVLNVKGDSMEPTILDEELIFVAPISDDGIVDGNIYVLMYENEIFVKRIRKEAFTSTYSLSSDNPAVGDIHLDNEKWEHCTIVGEVVGQMRRRD